MHPSSKTPVLWLMLIIFLTSLATSGLNSKWLAHELHYDHGTLVVFSVNAQTTQLDAASNPDAEQLSDTDHQILHFVDHFPSLLLDSFHDGLTETLIQARPILFYLLLLPLVDVDPPFRPPQTTFRI